VRDGKTGLLTPPKDPARLARAISRLLTDRDEAKALGTAGRKLVLELCTDEARAARVEQLYREVLAERAARRP
jgi:glycosyltransferase involved in cell wall biosynthesis